MNLKEIISRNLNNSLGWRTSRKIVIFESDDWGSVRMPSREVFFTLKNNNIPVEKSQYCKFENLESNLDLEFLFDILVSFKDSNGNHPILTANTVVANPNFERIEENGFQEYHWEPFVETLKKYPNHNNVYSLYKKGIKDKIFYPQFH